jgi:hypothetical protein
MKENKKIWKLEEMNVETNKDNEIDKNEEDSIEE